MCTRWPPRRCSSMLSRWRSPRPSRWPTCGRRGATGRGRWGRDTVRCARRQVGGSHVRGWAPRPATPRVVHREDTKSGWCASRAARPFPPAARQPHVAAPCERQQRCVSVAGRPFGRPTSHTGHSRQPAAPPCRAPVLPRTPGRADRAGIGCRQLPAGRGSGRQGSRRWRRRRRLAAAARPPCAPHPSRRALLESFRRADIKVQASFRDHQLDEQTQRTLFESVGNGLKKGTLTISTAVAGGAEKVGDFFM